MNSDAYREFLLKSIPTAVSASGGKEVNCRCLFCPDSRDPKSKHMYISIPQSDSEPSLYNCYKCHNSGIVTYKKLIEWDIYDDEIALDLISHNENCGRYSSNLKYTSKIKYNVRHNTITDNELSKYKLDYINNRIGTHYSYEDLCSLKIILNLYDILKENNITNLTRHPKLVDQLDKNFLGFLSIDNAFLNMRRLCDKGLVDKYIDKRYINYKIFDKFDTSERFYTIPSAIDLCVPYRVKINIAEGPFDILSIYENVRHREPGIYTSIAGSNYKGIALYFLETYKIPNAELHYYPDNDQFGKTSNIKKIADYFRSIGIPLYLHRNIYPGEKDFGVSPDRIQESIMLL